ncbi:c-type cytochrome [Caldimonas sp. KR1-144]|uniref:c-type cytochrome n=1 Tax=Caldimonas sp. KR1-144 TaxID=3400911 RepID=UPI003C0BBA6C
MVMAVALIVIVIASVVFHFVSPWWAPKLASNWAQMDHTLTITLVITGLFFIVLNLFVVLAIVRYRHRNDGRRAAYEPENPRLERRLTVWTSVGIAALLAPGLYVYAEYVKPPADAMVVEVLGQQWQWRYRLPGPDGALGGTDARFVAAANPFGIDPADAKGSDDVLVLGNELHLPVDKPVKMLLRAHDVLHDYYVPPFRARMNIVPGMVTTFWFTPTTVGRYEAMCAQLCGVGHAAMRGYVVVEDDAAYRGWVAAQPSFGAALAAAKSAAPAAPTAGGEASLADRGRAIAQAKGCTACHSVDGSAGVGPTWKGLFGKTETMADGSQVKVDDEYLKSSVRTPSAQVVKGFAPVMPPSELSDDEMAALIGYMKAQ